MKIKVFYPNEKGNIELTKEKLEAILTEAYNEGYHDGRYHNGYYYGVTTTPYVSSTSGADIAYLSSTTPSISAEKLCGKVASATAIDCCDKAVATIDCYINTNDRITADALNTEAKSAITVAYGEG